MLSRRCSNVSKGESGTCLRPPIRVLFAWCLKLGAFGEVDLELGELRVDALTGVQSLQVPLVDPAPDVLPHARGRQPLVRVERWRVPSVRLGVQRADLLA